MARPHHHLGRAQSQSRSDYRLRRISSPYATTRAQIGLAPAFQPYAITLTRTIGTERRVRPSVSRVVHQIGSWPMGFLLDCRTDMARKRRPVGAALKRRD